jgi:dCTP deaminase
VSVLSVEQLDLRLRVHGSGRLVIAPILEPALQMESGRAAVDVRLGCRFRLAETTTEGLVDTVLKPDRSPPKQPIFVPFGRSIVLHPHQFLLGETLEFVRMPDDLMAYVVGRSSWGRDGLVVATAVGIHPGFTGSVTLELRNLGELPMSLYPGDPIAQLFIHGVERPKDAKPPKPSQFSGASGPRPGTHRYPETARRLNNIIDRQRAAKP